MGPILGSCQWKVVACWRRQGTGFTSAGKASGTNALNLLNELDIKYEIINDGKSIVLTFPDTAFEANDLILIEIDPEFRDTAGNGISFNRPEEFSDGITTRDNLKATIAN